MNGTSPRQIPVHILVSLANKCSCNKSLTTVGHPAVGEPLNREAWDWYYDVVGQQRCDIVDTWWQTG